MESFANNPAADAKAGNKPSGLPGTAPDEGATKNIFSDNQQATDAQHTGPAARLEGVLGDGQSLQELLGAAGDHAKANTRYRALYNAMAPAAQDAVEQEDIPHRIALFYRPLF